MPGIYMICPSTGREVFTSQHCTDYVLDLTLKAGGRFRCSVCNQVHAWTAADAIVGGNKAHLRSDVPYKPRNR